MTKAYARHPYAKVEFATETGELTIFQKLKKNDKNMDLNIISLETKRDIGSDDCATFSITLVYKEEWYKHIGGNDLVVIRLGDGVKEKPIFFGMVDSIYESESYPELIPTRSLVINGRGFNKALIQFGIGAITDLEVAQSPTGFFPEQTLVMAKNSPAKIIETAYKHYLEKGIDINFANGESYKSLSNSMFLENVEDRDLTVGDEQLYINFQGGLWEYLKELRNAPFYEIYWEVVDDKPTIIVRPTPFNQEEWEGLAETKLDDFAIINKNLGRSDLETYTCYTVKGETMYSGLQEYFGKPLWYPPFYSKYGLRRLQVNSKYVHWDDVPAQTEESSSENSSELSSAELQDLGGIFPFPLKDHTHISSYFGSRKHPVTGKQSNHTGIDIPAPGGTPIPAVADGIVKEVGHNQYSGHYIEIQHDNGIVTRYQHCRTKPTPLEGERVKQGQVIAAVGSTGRSTGNHLHFEVKVNGKQVDPLPYIKGGDSSKGAKGDGEDKTKISKVDWDKAKLKSKNSSFEENDKKMKDNLNKYAGMLQDDTKKEVGLGYFQDILGQSLTSPFERLGSGNTDVKDLGTRLDERSQEQKEQALADYEEQKNSSFVSQKTINLFNWNILNNQMENGSITVIGDVDYKIGTRLLITSTDMEYYIENVSHSFRYNESWTTNLEVTRGLKKGTRFDPPWDSYAVMTADDVFNIMGISAQQLEEVSTGSSTNTKNLEGLSTTRQNLVKTFLSKEGETYSQSKRMDPGYSDCSSFVYKRTCEALGKDYKGTWAPGTSAMDSCDLWYEIPMSEALPGDILWRSGHTEFVSDEGMQGRSFGAHKPGTPAGYGAKISNYGWKKAYRIKGVN